MCILTNTSIFLCCLFKAPPRESHFKGRDQTESGYVMLKVYKIRLLRWLEEGLFWFVTGKAIRMNEFNFGISYIVLHILFHL